MKIRTILYILAFLALSSCTEKIDLELNDGFIRLVVEAELTNEAKAHEVRLSTTASYFSNEPVPMVSGASVLLSDGNDEILLTEKSPGIYVTPNDFQGVPGRKYSLRIELKEAIANETIYTAESFLNTVTESDSIWVEDHPDWGKGFYEVHWYAMEPPSTDFYMFRLFQNNVLLTDSLKEWSAFDDRFVNGNYLNGLGVVYLARELGYSIKPGDSLTLMACGITKEFQIYLDFMRRQLNNQNPLFGGPPTNVFGNISGGALGYFAAYSTSYVSTVYSIRKAN
jgi:hypothetical protein